MNRRGCVRLLGSTVIANTIGHAAPISLSAAYVKSARASVFPDSGDIEVIRRWDGPFCRSMLRNRGRQPAAIENVVLFSLSHAMADETTLYGESFQMLSQTGGTLGRPIDFAYSERNHYRIPQPSDATAVTGLLTLTPPGDSPIAMAFTSCRRFNGRFYLRPGSIEVVLDTEGLVLAAGETWELEEFAFLSGASRSAMLDSVAARMNRNHRPLRFPTPPTGWCSWYCFGPKVTAQQVLDNLDIISSQIPQLRYVQIDDGYQPAMGDWLETGNAFGGDVRGVLKAIRERGFEPAIWVAPFIAEAGSKLFQQHPDWFMKDAEGKPLPSNKVTFQGWRRGPWYALDGTRVDVQKHFEELFRTMRQQWGVTYFKLDANFWGAMHGGRLHDRKATRIEAYRRGMQAILRGAGDAFILGCNHPILPSLGLIHGSRSSGDISRRWAKFKGIARENLSRNWQNGKLWWNDPDAIVLTGDLSEDEFQFHATMAFAAGGMILSGDDLTRIPPQRLAMLKKLLPPTGRAAAFEDESLRVGFVGLPTGRAACVFNWEDEPRDVTIPLTRDALVRDCWTGASLGKHQGTFEIKSMPGHSARVLLLT